MAEAMGITVAAWNPLADGILSGKFTAANAAGPGTRIDPATLSDHQRAIATLVQDVAGDLMQHWQ
jgi:aryl-alcohol dehydrogenase-like predicted oxidoreductase